MAYSWLNNLKDAAVKKANEAAKIIEQAKERADAQRKKMQESEEGSDYYDEEDE